MRRDALLCSINERLAGGEGVDLPPLGHHWLVDLAKIAEIEAEEMEEFEEEIKGRGQNPDGAEMARIMREVV